MSDDFYEVCPNRVTGHGDDEETLSVGLTSNNGLRIEVLNKDLVHWACYHFDTPDEAEAVAADLMRLARKMRAGDARYSKGCTS